ncbi:MULTISPECIES: hypothetical protein [unclassified Burkholderia]|uniref:hypothetical protein n=1 Tax=unclassified Burkholderia TaxID=2613784 RepID=UPI001E4A9A3D|nr:MULTISPECIES: hypothetical protein [unclassified Burkholderia]UEP31724.1 hypothetical protein LMA01_21210 [Burkholderia sp. B21-007]UEP43032.1 hypothetical protein LMA02_23420 [Burkholderia sp. B21-005]
MKLKPVVSGIAALVLSACGGGGSSSSSPPEPAAQTVSGVAAAGAAMQGATVKLIDATGKSVDCPADAATGAFHCTVTGLTAPFALSAYGNVADSQATLIALSATGGTQTINITPITNAIAATIVGDNPTKLLGDTGLLQSKVTAQAVAGTVQAYSAVLADLLAATGNTGVDLISGPLTAGAPGLDRLLDQVKINVLPNGGVQISSVAGASSDTPVQLELAPGVAPQASDKASLPAAATIGGVTVSNLPSASDLAGLRSALNQCFAGSTGAARADGKVPACGQIFVDDVASGALNTGVPAAYLNNGMSVDQEFGAPAGGGAPGIVADDAMNNASFSLPEVIRVVAGDTMWVKFAWTRTDGIRDGMQQHVQLAVRAGSLASGDTGWRVVGNQRAVLSKVNANAQKWDWLNAAIPMTGTNAFIDSMNLQVGTVDAAGAPVDFAIVNGPGLRNGVFLQPSSGTCDTLNIRAQIASGQTPAQLAALSKTPQCRNNYRLAGVAQDPANQGLFSWPGDAPRNNTAWAKPQLSAAELADIKPFSAYTIDVYQNGNTATPARHYTLRLRTPSPLPDALRQYAWHDVAQSTRDRLTPGTASTFAGGATFPLSWTSKAGLPFVKRGNVQIRATAAGQPSPMFVNGSARALPAQPGATVTLDVPGDQGVAFPSVAGWTGSTDFSFVNLSWSDTVDMLFSEALEYDR